MSDSSAILFVVAYSTVPTKANLAKFIYEAECVSLHIKSGSQTAQ